VYPWAGSHEWEETMPDSKMPAGAITRRGTFKLAAALLSTAALPALTRAAMAASEDDQVLRIAHPVFNMDWSPLRGGGDYLRWNSLWWASAAYFDSDNKLHPYVFTSWTPGADNKSWTFKIADGAKFSDGSPITAVDVKGSWELSAMPTTRNQRVDLALSSVQGYQEVINGKAKDMSGLIVKDDKTLEVQLAEVDPIFFERVATQVVPIIKASQARDDQGEEIAEWWNVDNGVIVSGPFKPTKMDLDGGKLTFEPNENFFGPKPILKRIEIQTVEDPVTATALMQKGQFDAHTAFATPTMDQDLGKDFASGVMIPKGQHFWLNVNRAPTNDLKVRQALIQAIDRDGLKSTYPSGPMEKADQILNSVPGVDPHFEAYPFDPAAAKKLLAESSYGGPDRLMLVGISTPASQLAAQYIAEQWRQNLGITAVEMKPQIDAYTGPDQANVQIFRDDVGTRVPDPVVYLLGTIFSGSSNAKNKLGGYANKDVDAKLSAAAIKAVDDPQRITLAQEAQKAFRDEWAFIPWYYEGMSKWAMPQVKNIVKNLDWQVYEPWKLSVERA
jgi:peptide/nickel transport system substrate-binding protein